MTTNLGSFIQTSLGASLPLQLISSPYLSGKAGVEPSYSTAQTLGLIAGANVLGQSLFASSGQTVSISSGIIAFKGQDLFAAPPCSLTVTVESSYSVLYISKKMSGASPSSAQIGLIVTSSSTTAQDALSSAQDSISGLFVPLCVLSADSSANQTIEWTLDENSQYSSPVLNQLGQIQQWENATKSFIETQLSALMSDLTGFASWEQSARNNQIEITFSLPSGQNLSGMNYALAGGEYVGDNNVMSPAAFIFSNYLAKFVQLVPGGIQNQTSSSSTGNYLQQIHNTAYGNDFWFAPSQNVSFPLAWQDISAAWIKGVQWQTDGNLYFTYLAPGEQDFPLSCGIYLGDGVTLNRYNGSEQVATLPPNPLANPTFQTGW